MMKRLSLSLTLALLPVALAGAEESTGEAEKITYEDHIKPIFRQHCLSCHNQSDAAGGLVLDSYTALREGGGSGEVVYDDGDVEGSRLWQLVNHDDTPIMPPNQDKIPADQLKLLRTWLATGVLENSGSKAKKIEKNALAMVASTGGKPDGPAAMPEHVPQRVPVVTERPAATTAIAASPWAPLVAVAGQRQIALYQPETAELLGVLPFPEGIPQSLRFNRDGSYLIAGGGEHAVRGIVAVYDVRTGERVATIGDELDTVFDGDVNDTMSRVALGGPQKMLRIYDATDGQLLFDLKKHTDWIYAVAYSPDGILVASGDRSGGLHLWEADTGRLYLDLVGHKGAIRSLAWRDDSNVLASASEDGTVKLWDVFDGKVIKSVNAHGGGATAVCFDHEGRFVTAGKDKRVRLWDASGNKVRDFQPMSEAVLEVAISHDGKHVAYGDWTGEVLSASVEDPAKKKPLASNPPPIPVRMQQVKRTLASIQTELDPLDSRVEQQRKAAEQARNRLAEVESELTAARDQAARLRKAAEQSEAERKALEAELPRLTRKTRDDHDAVIAARLGLQAGSAKLDDLVAAEENLGKQLLQLAEKRRTVAKLGDSAAENRKRASEHEAAAKKWQQQVAERREAAEQAEQALAEAEQARAAVASRFEETKQKLDLLASELQ